MKKIIVLVLIGITLAVTYSDFCEGYKIGYKKGYCYGQWACMEPMAPMCPMPRMGESGFYDGYNRGFLDGSNN